MNEMKSAGYDDPTAQNLLMLKSQGIDAEFIRKYKGYG